MPWVGWNTNCGCPPCEGEGCEYQLCVQLYFDDCVPVGVDTSPNLTIHITGPGGYDETGTIDTFYPPVQGVTYCVWTPGDPPSSGPTTPISPGPAPGSWTIEFTSPSGSYEPETINATVVECESQTISVTFTSILDDISFSQEDMNCHGTPAGGTFELYDADTVPETLITSTSGTATDYTLSVPSGSLSVGQHVATVFTSICEGVKVIRKEYTIGACKTPALTACFVDGSPVSCPPTIFDVLSPGWLCDPCGVCDCPIPAYGEYSDPYGSCTLVYGTYTYDDIGAPFTFLHAPSSDTWLQDKWVGVYDYECDNTICCDRCPDSEGYEVGAHTIRVVIVADCTGSSGGEHRWSVTKYFFYYFATIIDGDCGALIPDNTAYPLCSGLLSCPSVPGILSAATESLSAETICEHALVTGTFDLADLDPALQSIPCLAGDWSIAFHD